MHTCLCVSALMSYVCARVCYSSPLVSEYISTQFLTMLTLITGVPPSKSPALLKLHPHVAPLPTPERCSPEALPPEALPSCSSASLKRHPQGASLMKPHPPEATPLKLRPLKLHPPEAQNCQNS